MSHTVSIPVTYTLRRKWRSRAVVLLARLIRSERLGLWGIGLMRLDWTSRIGNGSCRFRINAVDGVAPR